MKNALDRYLNSVKEFLPRAQPADILRELEENLRSEMEEREAELGRPLNEADREAILARHGSPVSVAGQYRRHEWRLAVGVELIGPDLFPHYLKWLAIPVAITTALFAAAFAGGKRPTPAEFLFPVLVQVACVTTLFVIVQAGQRRYGWLDHWKTPSLPGPELVRRYLYVVQFWLPKQQRDDIAAELAENLRSEIEEREAELGRKLDEAELVAILKAHGEPIAVATPYLPARYVIGPALYPLYRFVLKLVVLGILVPMYVVVVGPLVVKASAHPTLAGIQALWNLVMAAVFSVGAVTFVFAMIELHARGRAPDWDPRQLPAPPARRADARGPMLWYRAASSMGVSALFTLAWVYLAQPQAAADFNGVRIALAPVWRSLFWPILAVLLGGAVVGVAGLLRPNAARLHAALRLVFDALGMAIIGVLLGAQSWVEIAAPGQPPAGIHESITWTNLGVWVSLLAAGAILLADAVREGWRAFRRERAPLAWLAAIALLAVFTPARAQSFPPSNGRVPDRVLRPMSHPAPRNRIASEPRCRTAAKGSCSVSLAALPQSRRCRSSA